MQLSSSAVLAASGFDVLSHAVESYTARSSHSRLAPTDALFTRPAAQGANMFSDYGCLAALELVGKYYARAVEGAFGKDEEVAPQSLLDWTTKQALNNMMFASTLAGTAMGNAGCQMPHAFSYPICGQNKVSFLVVCKDLTL